MEQAGLIPHSLEVHALGENGEVEILPTSSDFLSTSHLPCGLPPILQDTSSVLNTFLTDIEKLPIFHVDAVQRYVPGEPDVYSLHELEPCPLLTELTVRRNMTTGKLLGFVEQEKDSVGGTTKTSTSLSRAPGKPEFGVKGSTNSFPFWPGGMDEPWANLLSKQPLDANLFDCDYLTIPPGFKKGMQFERKQQERNEILEKISLTDVFQMDHLIDLEPFEEEESQEDNVDLENLQRDKEPETADERIKNEMIRIENLPVLQISKTVEVDEITKAAAKCKWAVVENISLPIDDFHERIPDMAFKWEFELDIFQKAAILHLEKRECVFVAAHTSAGKTVVAEYAVALAKRHMTRVLYTSPIKALSNQKFRDFKASFEDVGLVTGDVVINPKAFCLIMTTEILRSMLYHGSDVVREVEWVIFDEVHYINDAERGVVWEEVFIMLPQHVNLIMLSATVPNTLEFAEWLGGIKKRKIYVISTLKRPIPLVYHLYTGSVGKTQDDNFVVVDANGNFSNEMYKKAVESKKPKETKQKTGPYQKSHQRHVMGFAQEKNIYIGLLGYLKKKELLPVVCFTLSRKKCNENASILKSQDLTTAKEKSEISYFFKKSISKLKVEDQELSQVKTMAEQLVQGFGVHHSGVLPILKEVVEMLFQKGLVKVLFATETFAMGVNMPARTVVFDSIRKHDGKEFRVLKPAEFIQMAGRAGRRGLDKTGTVIILCKSDVPDIVSLQSMMLGKPEKLKSQFKLTYNMILNLLKVKTLKVEDVMERSFSESGVEQRREKLQEQLAEASNKLSKLKRPDCSLCFSDLEPYYKTLDEANWIRDNVMDKVCEQAIVNKIFTVGRIISFSAESHPNVAGIVLNIYKDKCKVLAVKGKTEESDSRRAWTKSLYVPDDASPIIMSVLFKDIQLFSNKTLKVDSDGIMKEWRKMETMGSSAGHTISSTFQDLMTFCQAANRNGFTEAKISFRDMDVITDYTRFRKLCDNLEDFKCLKCPQFSSHFSCLSQVYSLQQLMKDCKDKMSPESLQHHPEYMNRKKVLKHLGYVDNDDNVQLKGSVAREMSNHELLITELLVRNVFSDCTPEEVAALLSCMVHQQKPKLELKSLGLLTKLFNKIQTIQSVIREIDAQQQQFRIFDANFVDQYNFELTQVVYEWAKGVNFAKIMQCEVVEVEEGIIVRCIQRLSEMLKDVRNGASIVGDSVLAKKMEDASRSIKRDIVFAASLYLQ